MGTPNFEASFVNGAIKQVERGSYLAASGRYRETWYSGVATIICAPYKRGNWQMLSDGFKGNVLTANLSLIER